MALIKAIVESTYAVVQSSRKRTAFERTVSFSKAIQLQATFNVYVFITLTLFWQK